MLNKEVDSLRICIQGGIDPYIVGTVSSENK